MKILSKKLTPVCGMVIFLMLLTPLSVLSAAAETQENTPADNRDKTVRYDIYQNCDMCMPPGNDSDGSLEISSPSAVSSNFLRSFLGIIPLRQIFTEDDFCESHISCIRIFDFCISRIFNTVMLC